jgi:hypothetical protein
MDDQCEEVIRLPLKAANISQTIPNAKSLSFKTRKVNRNSERIPRRFCLTAVLRGLRGASIRGLRPD